jgi:hypothetical protein
LVDLLVDLPALGLERGLTDGIVEQRPERAVGDVLVVVGEL